MPATKEKTKMKTKNEMTHDRILTSLDFASLDAKLQPDTRRMMREEAFQIRFTMQRGNAAQIAAKINESKRVAEMWGVEL